MRVRGLARPSGDHGMTTSEYATGCVATATIAGTLAQLVGSGFFGDLFGRVFDVAFTTPLPDLFGALW